MKVTLMDIARRLGVTPSTVQRALTGASGVSEKRRQEICAIAQEMGYRLNYHASSLKRGARRITALLPSADGAGYSAASQYWQGVHLFISDLHTLDVDLLPLRYDGTVRDQLRVLNMLLSREEEEIDGLVTCGGANPELGDTLAMVQAQGIRVAVLGADTLNRRRFFCARANDALAGRMAADLLMMIGAPTQMGKIILCGDLTDPGQQENAKRFEEQLWQTRQAFAVHKIARDGEDAAQAIGHELTSHVPLFAIYACSETATLSVCRALRENRPAAPVHAIGNGLNAEIAACMEAGILGATLQPRTSVMAYQAVRSLYMELAQGIRPEKDVLEVDMALVTPGNLAYYQQSGGAMPGQEHGTAQ